MIRLPMHVALVVIVTAAATAPPALATPPAAPPAAPPAEAPIAEAPGAGGKLPSSLSKGKIVIRDAAGNELYSLKPKGEDAAKLYDAKGNELGKLTLSADKIKVKSADDKPLFELKRKDDKVMIKDAGDKELFKIKLKGDGYDIYGANDARLYRIKKRGQAFIVEDNGEHLRGKTGREGGSSEIRDAQDQNVLSSKELVEPMGLVFYQMRELTPLQQSACLLFFLRK